ncbi:MAG: TIGR04282 family arsenosugar biosynthesis glycosyltransferase [Saprospiraceae bacterium]|nr:TIGR04282 family arsenosugar biosynthesis glycosyltransferase [Saprospiraceae bacterium]
MDGIVSKTALVIFVKNLVPGRVKTRIASQSSDENACHVYEALQRITATVCNVYDGPKYLYYSDFIADQDLWSSNIYTKKAQSGVDLGSRMLHAFEEILAVHDSAMIIGSDCPYLKSEDLIRAGKDLENSDLVLGPAGDGGFYLIGSKNSHPELLLNREWSQPNVFGLTARIATKLGLKTSVLRMLWDIDTLADWQFYLQYNSPGSKR